MWIKDIGKQARKHAIQRLYRWRIPKHQKPGKIFQYLHLPFLPSCGNCTPMRPSKLEAGPGSPCWEEKESSKLFTKFTSTSTGEKSSSIICSDAFDVPWKWIQKEEQNKSLAFQASTALQHLRKFAGENINWTSELSSKCHVLLSLSYLFLNYILYQWKERAWILLFLWYYF